MPTQLLKRTLKIINQAGSDIAQYDHFIKLNISALVDSKEVASGLVSAIAHNDDQGKDDISNFLVMLLDEVRMSLENDYGYGAEFPGKIEGAVQIEISSGSLTSEDLMRFAVIFHRAGLAVPQSLVLEPSTTVPPIDAEDIDISELMEDLARKIEAEGGTPYDGYVGLDELLVAVPAEIRVNIAHYIAASDSHFLERCAMYLILSDDPDKRSAVIAGFTQKVAAQKLSTDTAIFLPVIRGWFPAGETQSSLDELIKRTRRKFASITVDTKNRAKIISINASMTDGVGAQQIAILLKQNKSLTMAMVLTKTGYGIKDAFLVPLQSMKEAEEMLNLVQASTGAGEILPDTLNLLLEAALADGLENNSLPEPGFIDVIEACSLLSLRPQQTSLDKLLDQVDPEGQIRDARSKSSAVGSWTKRDICCWDQ